MAAIQFTRVHTPSKYYYPTDDATNNEFKIGGRPMESVAESEETREDTNFTRLGGGPSSNHRGSEGRQKDTTNHGNTKEVRKDGHRRPSRLGTNHRPLRRHQPIEQEQIRSLVKSGQRHAGVGRRVYLLLEEFQDEQVLQVE